MPRLPTTAIRGLFHPQRFTRQFHPEPRSLQTSAHAAHRAFYRWTAQAIGTPFLVAYLCERLSNRSESGGSNWKLDISQMEGSLLTEPLRMKGQVWGTTIRDMWEWLREGEAWMNVKELLY